jgi:predicted ATPase
MPAYILTGAPGSLKTAILRMLEDVGYPVVEEAATDVIALGNAYRAAPGPIVVPGAVGCRRRGHNRDRSRLDGCCAS